MTDTEKQEMVKTFEKWQTGYSPESMDIHIKASRCYDFYDCSRTDRRIAFFNFAAGYLLAKREEKE